MSAPTPLLVPMALQALLVNGPVQQDADRQFKRWPPDYANLNSFVDPYTPAFTDTVGPPPLGVHLHWRLPAALTRARGKSTQKAQFLLAPNRWIVVRLAAAGDAKSPARLTAWIVESDFLDPQEGTNPFVDLAASRPGNVAMTRLGRNVTIEQWEGEPGRPMFLQPTGLADVTFTAFQPGISDVFAFHDDTTALAENTQLTYLVAGWYSDPQHDPLASPDPLAQPPATLTPAALDWTVLGDSADAPSFCVLHAMLYGVAWQSTSVPARIDPDAKSMQVAVGYTAVDALAAIIAARAGTTSGSELEAKLEAFQYDVLHMLDEPDWRAQLEVRTRQAWFGSTPSGTRWSIVPVGQGDQQSAQTDPLVRTPLPAAPALTSGQETWLAALNVTQRSLDTLRRDLKTQQWELFALWWKSQRAPFVQALLQSHGIDPAVLLQSIVAALDAQNSSGPLAAILAQQVQVNDLTAQVPDPTSPDSIDAWSRRIPDQPQSGTADAVALRLRPSALPAFSHPADPVVLIAGLDPPTNDVDDRVPLPCRTLAAVVTGVRVGGNNVTPASGTLAGMIPLPSTARLPAAIAPAVTALATEAFFADPNDAASIVTNGLGASDPGTIAALQAAMTDGSAQISTIAGPLQAAFAFAPWRQAWAPLFMQWEITWFPSVAATASGPTEPPGDDGAQDNWSFAPDGWHFDGGDNVDARGAEYYQWTGGEPWGLNDGQVAPRTYVGRTFLTPHATFLLLRRLADYVKLHRGDPDLDQIEALIEAIGETRFLSQALGGFNAAFVMRGLSHAPPPDPTTPVGGAIAGENRGVPMVDVGEDSDLSFGGGVPFFFPVRGGFFQFEKLEIVDSFGQVLNMMAANGNDGFPPAPENFMPIRGSGLVPDPDGGIATPGRRIKQAPRIVQPARLDLRLLDAADDSQEVFYAPSTNPVCGWVLPNHLDRSIAVYDTAGQPLGELLVLADVSGQEIVRWLAAPDTTPPIDDPARIANAHLAAMFTAFTADDGGIASAQRVAAFRALYQSIDETLWTVDPPGGQSDHDLAVLIGRPLAVVRAQIQFELYGRPAVNQSWRDTLQGLDAGLTGFTFPLRLGSTELLSDGLIGFFTGDTYTTFNAVHASTTMTSPYVAAIAPGNYLALPFDYPGYTVQNLTLLLDPRGTVDATTGILPVATLQLPAQFYAAALARIAVTFRTGPVLTDPASIRIPFPAEQHGTWSWIGRTGTGATDWEVDPIVPANAQARLADETQRLVEGWLKFIPGNDAETS